MMLVFTGLVCTSCSEDEEEAGEKQDYSTLIYGNWKAYFDGGYEMLVFRKDGTYTEKIYEDGQSVWLETGTFKVEGDVLILDRDDSLSEGYEDKLKFNILELTSSVLLIQLTHVYDEGKWEALGEEDMDIVEYQRVN